MVMTKPKKNVVKFLSILIVCFVIGGFQIVLANQSLEDVLDQTVVDRVAANGPLQSGFIKNDGTVWVAGRIHYDTKMYDAEKIEGLTKAKSISQYAGSFYVADFTGKVYTWSYENINSVSKEEFEEKSKPVLVGEGEGSTFASNVIQVVAKYKGAYMLQENGKVGELDNTILKFVDGLTDIIRLRTNGLTFAAINNEGEVWVWGDNSSNLLRDDGTVEVSELAPPNITKIEKPMKITEITDAKDVVISQKAIIILKNDKNVYGMGSNKNGILGDFDRHLRDNEKEYSFVPHKIEALSNVSKICGVGTMVGAITENGEMYIWGYNWYGTMTGTDADGETNYIPSKVDTSVYDKIIDIYPANMFFSSTNGFMFIDKNLKAGLFGGKVSRIADYGFENMRINNSSSNTAISEREPINIAANVEGKYIKINWDLSELYKNGYNVYKKLGEATSYDEFEKLNDMLINTNSFTDELVLPGHKYSYYITSLDSNGDLLEKSNIISIETKNEKMVLKIDSPKMKYKGKSSKIVPPTLISGVTYLPIRPIIEALDGNVSWEGKPSDGGSGVITIQLNNRVIKMRVGSHDVILDGEVVETIAPVIIKENRSLSPLRFVLEKLGYNVEWNGNTREISIF